jgi:hypothetical protein
MPADLQQPATLLEHIFFKLTKHTTYMQDIVQISSAFLATWLAVFQKIYFGSGLTAVSQPSVINGSIFYGTSKIILIYTFL